MFTYRAILLTSFRLILKRPGVLSFEHWCTLKYKLNCKISYSCTLNSSSSCKDGLEKRDSAIITNKLYQPSCIYSNHFHWSPNTKETQNLIHGCTRIVFPRSYPVSTTSRFFPPPSFVYLRIRFSLYVHSLLPFLCFLRIPPHPSVFHSPRVFPRSCGGLHVYLDAFEIRTHAKDATLWGKRRSS